MPDADPFAPAAAAGIHRLAIPTPFAVGRVNVYLIEDDPLTLVDSGPNSGISLDEVDRQLAALGRRIDDLELILITHQHIDHIGLVEILRSRSGADVAAIEQLVPFVERYREAATAEDEFATETMLRHGIPPEVVQALRAVSSGFRAWGARADVTRTLHDNEVIELRDRSLRVAFRPGHSPTDTVFHDEERRILIAADHLIAHVSSNPLLTRPVGGGERRRALVEYLESLRKTRSMDVELVLPGHGDPITDHRKLVDSRLELHARRANKIHGLIAAEGPLSAHAIAQRLWGDIAVTQAFLTLSEVIGHTDILELEGRVRMLEDDGVVRYEAT
ncbi:MAG TPA: MBL fold metallo-hydrolase [Thermoleophilaceae bacterium]|nr:MBL fold metallo-hydrolase [Thermoleophilaceae bacterium]